MKRVLTRLTASAAGSDREKLKDALLRRISLTTITTTRPVNGDPFHRQLPSTRPTSSAQQTRLFSAIPTDSQEASSASSASASATTTMASTSRGFVDAQQTEFHRDMQKDAAANRSAARAFINTPVGSITPETWLEANHLLNWWSIQRTVESVDMSFMLLRRVLQEQRHCHHHEVASMIVAFDSQQWLDKELLNLMLNNWRVVWWEQYSCQELAQYTPRMVWDIVEDYYTQYGFVMNEKSFYLILEAEHSHPSHRSAVGPNKHYATPDMAHAMMDRLLELYNNSQSVTADCLPSTEFCNLAMRTWNTSNRAKEAPQKCESLFEVMIQYNIPVNTRSYRMVLQAWARLGTKQGVLQAHDLLYQMHTKFLQGDISLRPDSAAVSTVIAAWSRSGARDAGQQALELYRHLGDLVQYNKIHVFNSLLTCFAQTRRLRDVEYAEELFQNLLSHGVVEDAAKPLPNAITYLILISAFAKVGRPDKALALLQKMQDGYAGGQENLKPTNSHFTSVISAYSQSNRNDKIEKIKLIMKRMEQLSRQENDESLKPTLTTYNAFLACFSRGRLPFAGYEAEKVLLELKARTNSDGSNFVPDRITYTTVINAYAKSGLSEHAVRVLDDMINDFKSGNESARPDLHAYNTVLCSFIKDNRSKNAAAQTSQFFETMKSLAAEGIIDKPDLVSYAALANALATAVDNSNAQRAEDVLRELQAAYEAGDQALRPNNILYNACINAWGKAGRPDRAGDLLREMFLDYQAGNERACPDLTSFNTLLKAFASAKRQDSGDKAEEIVERMLDLHQSGTLDVRPDDTTYSTLVVCHVLSRKPGSLDRADELLNLMDRLYAQGKLDRGPKKKTFDTVRRGWKTSQSPHRHVRVKALRKEIQARFPSTASKPFENRNRDEEQRHKKLVE